MPFNVAIQETRHFKGMQQVFPNPRICAQAFVPTRIFFQYYCLRFQFASSETVTLSLSISICNFLQARISVALYMYATGVGLANMCLCCIFRVVVVFFSGLDILAINWETVSVSSVLNIICSFSYSI